MPLSVATCLLPSLPQILGHPRHGTTDCEVNNSDSHVILGRKICLNTESQPAWDLVSTLPGWCFGTFFSQKHLENLGKSWGVGSTTSWKIRGLWPWIYHNIFAWIALNWREIAPLQACSPRATFGNYIASDTPVNEHHSNLRPSYQRSIYNGYMAT